MEGKPNKEYIFGAIFSLANRLQALGDKIDKNITVKQWFFVAIVSMFESPPSILEVSKLIGTSRQNIKKMATILQNQGFVTIQEDSNDKRVSRILLTKKCFDYFKTRENMEQSFIESLFNDFTEKSIEDLSNNINLLMNNIETMEKEYENKGVIKLWVYL